MRADKWKPEWLLIFYAEGKGSIPSERTKYLTQKRQLLGFSILLLGRDRTERSIFFRSEAKEKYERINLKKQKPDFWLFSRTDR